VLLALTAACGSNGNQETGGAEAKVAIEPAKTPEPVELVFFSTAGWTQDAFNERFGNAMRSKFPNYQIKYIQSNKETTIDSLLTSGTTIDVYWHAVNLLFSDLLQYQMQLDMSSLVKKHNVDLDRLDPATLQIVKTMSGGKLYALPLVSNTGVLYYNKDIFDKFGVPYPKNGMVWDDVLELGKKVNRADGGKTYYGIGGTFNKIVGLSPYSIPYIDSKTMKPTIQTDPHWKTIYQQLIDAYHTTENKAMSSNNFLKDQNLAMFADLANLFLNKDMTSMNWDMASFPTMKEAPNKGQQPLPTLFSITSMSKHPDQAMEVLKYMLSDELQKDLSERAVIPAVNTSAVVKAFGTKSTYKNKNFSAIFFHPFSDIPPMTAYDADALKIYQKPLTKLAEGTLDLNTAFRQIDEETSQMIAEKKAK
jgi:multiple sugar transport system substrate-binding protein